MRLLSDRTALGQNEDRHVSAVDGTRHAVNALSFRLAQESETQAVASAKRRATSVQLTTFHHASM